MFGRKQALINRLKLESLTRAFKQHREAMAEMANRNISQARRIDLLTNQRDAWLAREQAMRDVLKRGDGMEPTTMRDALTDILSEAPKAD